MVCDDARSAALAQRCVVTVIFSQTFAVLVPVAVPAEMVMIKRGQPTTVASATAKVLPAVAGGLGATRNVDVLARFVSADDVPSARGAATVKAVELS